MVFRILPIKFKAIASAEGPCGKWALQRSPNPGAGHNLHSPVALSRLLLSSLLPTTVGTDPRECLFPIPLCEEQVPAELVVHPE